MEIVSILGIILIVIGFWGMLTRKNIIKMIVSFSIVDTGIHLVIVSVGYIRGKSAPIFNDVLVAGKDAASKVVDPIPSALVLTAIVIGLAVTALMLSYAIQMYKKRQSLNIDDYEELRW